MNDQENPRKMESPDSFFRPAQEIRDALSISEREYANQYGFNSKYPREYYVYGVLDELERVGMAVMRWEELLDEGEKNSDPQPTDGRIERNLFASLSSEQSFWIRRLTEVLTELISFKRTNEEDYYRHYFLIRDIAVRHREVKDLEEFFCCKNGSKTSFRDSIKREADSLRVDRSRCWYLSGKWSLANFEQIYKLAIENEKDKALRLALRQSYYLSYGRLSRELHFQVGSPQELYTRDDIRKGIGGAFLLSSHILDLCARLVGMKKGRVLSRVRTALRVSKVQHGNFRSLFNSSIRKGDFVLAQGDLAEVIGVNMSKYGYKSFEIHFLSTIVGSGWSRPDDCFPSQAVRRYVDRKKISDEIKELLERDGSKKDGRRINKCIRETVIDMWENAGFRELAGGRKDLAVKKIEAFVNRKDIEKLSK